MGKLTYDFNLGGTQEEQAKDAIAMMRKSLVDLRSTTRFPKELEWEIRVYDYMLEDPVIRLEQYFKARWLAEGQLAKRDAIKNLGWDVK